MEESPRKGFCRDPGKDLLVFQAQRSPWDLASLISLWLLGLLKSQESSGPTPHTGESSLNCVSRPGKEKESFGESAGACLAPVFTVLCWLEPQVSVWWQELLACSWESDAGC